MAAPPEPPVDPARPQQTVGVYDRPASADRRRRLLKIAVGVALAAAAAAGFWMLDPG